MSGFSKHFKDGTGGLRGGANNATLGFRSAERKITASNVWDDSIPVGYWDMSDGSGTKVSDVSSAGNDLSGTLKGTSDDYPDWDSTNKVRGSYSLLFEDGSSQASWTADNNVLDFNVDDPFSMSAWIKKISGTSTADASIMAKLATYSITPADNDFEGYELYLKGGKQPTFLLYQDGSNYLWTHGGATDEIEDTDWHHILVTYNGNSDLSGVKIYIDGSAASMTQTTDTLDTSDDIVTQTDFSIGARGLGRTTGTGTRNHFDGNIDEAAIWSKVLSTDEIADVYNSGDANDLTDGIPKS